MILNTVMWLSQSQALFSSKLANIFLNSFRCTVGSVLSTGQGVFLVATVTEVKVAPQHGSEVLQSSDLQARQWLFTDLCLPSPKVVTTLFASFSLPSSYGCAAAQ